MVASGTRVLAIDGSTHKDTELALLLRCVLNGLEENGLSIELIELAGKEIHNCQHCHDCSVRKDRFCIQADDAGNEIIEKMAQADVILFGHPACETEVAPKMQSLMDRSCMVAKANDQLFRRKVGAAITPLNCAGAVDTFDTLNHFFLINEMIVPGSTFWRTGIASEITGADRESESLDTMKALTKNIVWLLSIVKGEASTPDLEEILTP